ncbi:MAG: hypothetical protein Q8S47_14890 [Phenylobacterium sp.]|nr:hypothetical protein [Phenylobacterium sp.]
MGAHEYIDAVDLQYAELLDGPPQLRRSQLSSAAMPVEGLRGQRDPAGFR